MGKGKKVTSGYWYYLDVLLGVCHGPVDEVSKIDIGDREAWSGSVVDTTVSGGSVVSYLDSNGRVVTTTLASGISIQKPNLFGGAKREGGVMGSVDVYMGKPDQAISAHIAAHRGSNIPAYRGILSLLFKNFAWSANNPYFKAPAIRVKRILKGWKNDDPWYPSKAEILSHIDYEETVVESLTLDGIANAGATSAAGISYGSFATQDEMVINYSAGAYSNWPNNSYNGGNTWSCEVRVTDADGNTTSHNAGWYPTAAAALAAAQANGEIRITGSTGYTIWLSDALPGDNRGSVTLRINKQTRSGGSANPAHIIYECLTNDEWGMGYSSLDIDETSFQEVADTLYEDGFGMCIPWMNQSSVEEFVSVIIETIGAVCRFDSSSGKFKLKLIRGDYDIGTITELNEDNCTLTSFQRAVWAETSNEVTVIYKSRYGEDVPMTVQDPANIEIQQAVVPMTKQYPGISSTVLAEKLALRDLHAVSTPLAKITVELDRSGWQLNVGDVFKATFPKSSISAVPFRIINCNRGTLTSAKIQIDAIEDVFIMPDYGYMVQAKSEWSNPVTEPSPITEYRMMEAPYYDVVRRISTADLDYLEPGYGFVTSLAIRPSPDSIAHHMFQSPVTGGPYEELGSGQFCPTGLLSADMAISEGPVTFVLTDDEVLESVVPGTYCYIDNEAFGVTAIDTGTKQVTATRGGLDTVPAAHAAGARVWFSEGFEGIDATERTDAEVSYYKLIPETGRGLLDVTEATEVSFTLDQRAERPYPPGKLQFNGEYFPAYVTGDVVLTWAHRDRTLQTVNITPFTDANIGPEVGVTYTVKVYGESNTLLHTEAGLTGTTWTYTEAVELSESGLGRSNNTLRFTVESVRSGLSSYQKHDFTVDRGGLGFNLGENLGAGV